MLVRVQPAIAFLLAAVGGAIAVFATQPFGFSLAAVVALLLVFYLAWHATPRHAFAYGWLFGTAHFLIGLWWIYSALSGHIGLPPLAALLLTVLFCAALALFPATALTLAAKSAPPGGLARLLALAACWTLVEWSRSWLLTGFPWLMLGYSQIPEGLFVAWAPLTGIIGVTFALTLAVAAVLALLCLPLWRQRLAAALLLLTLYATPLAVNHLWQWVVPTGTLQVSLLQGNVKQSLKWQPEVVRQALKDYQVLIARAQGQVVILPETALPLVTLPSGMDEAMRAQAVARDGAVIAGMFAQEGDAIYNVAVAWQADAAQQYRKVHLTPYGEYLPFAEVLAPLLGAAGVPYSSLSAGDTPQPLSLPQGITTAVSICYEDIFGNEWRRQLPQAAFLTNITNDAWFDNTIMPAQHLQMAQARALEMGRWLVRATNTGISAVVDEKGRVVAQLPQQVQDILEAEITLYRGATPYVRWGDSTAVALACLLLLGTLAQRWRQA